MVQTNGEKQSKMIVDLMTVDLKNSFSDAKIVSDFAGIGRFVTGFRLWDLNLLTVVPIPYNICVLIELQNVWICEIIFSSKSWTEFDGRILFVCQYQDARSTKVTAFQIDKS